LSVCFVLWASLPEIKIDDDDDDDDDGMRSRFYDTVERLSVCPCIRPSVCPSINSSSGGRRVCCWVPSISIDGGRRRRCVPTACELSSNGAAARRSAAMRAVSR